MKRSKVQEIDQANTNIEKIHIKLPLHMVTPDNLKDLKFSFKDENGNNLLDINQHNIRYWRDYNDLPTNLKGMSEDYFYIAEDENNKIKFYTSIVKDGRKTVGGSLDLRMSENRENFTAISPLEPYGVQGTGFQTSAFSSLNPIEKSQYDKYCNDNIELTLLMNAVIDRNMLDLNSSFFSSNVGQKAMDNYLNNIYDAYQQYHRPSNMDMNDLNLHIKNFINDEEIKKIIIESRNEFDKSFTQYRERELFCIINHEEFLKENEMLSDLKFQEECAKYDKLINKMEAVNYYQSITQEERENIKKIYNEMKDKGIDANPDTSFLKIYKQKGLIEEAENYMKTEEFKVDKEKLDFYNLTIGEENLYKYKTYEDILWYYNQNIDMYPVYSPNLNPKEMSIYKEDLNKYQSEHLFHEHNLRYINKAKHEQDLKHYFSEDYEVLNNNFNLCNEKIDLLIKENQEILKDLKGLSRLGHSQYKDVFEQKDLDKIIFTEEDFEKIEDAKKLAMNTKKINVLYNYLQSDFSKSGHEINIDPELGCFYNLKLSADNDAKEIVIHTNMRINEKMLLEGKTLFGIDDNWDKIKDKENVTVKDKYVFYQIFDDVENAKKYMDYLESQRNYFEGLLKEINERYKEKDDPIEKETHLRDLSKNINNLNVTNQKIEFLNEYFKYQEIDLDQSKKAKYNEVGEKLFGKDEFESFSGTYQEVYNKYKEIGFAFGTRLNILEQNRESLKNDPYNPEYKKAVAESQQFLRELSEKYSFVREYLNEHKININEKVEDIVKDPQIEKMQNASILERDRVETVVLDEKVENANKSVVFESVKVDDKEYKISKESDFEKFEKQQEKLEEINKDVNKRYLTNDLIEAEINKLNQRIQENGKLYIEKSINGTMEELDAINQKIREDRALLDTYRNREFEKHNIIAVETEAIEINKYRSKGIETFFEIEKEKGTLGETMEQISNKIQHLEEQIKQPGLALALLERENAENLKIEDIDNYISKKNVQYNNDVAILDGIKEVYNAREKHSTEELQKKIVAELNQLVEEKNKGNEKAQAMLTEPKTQANIAIIGIMKESKSTGTDFWSNVQQDIEARNENINNFKIAIDALNEAKDEVKEEDKDKLVVDVLAFDKLEARKEEYTLYKSFYESLNNYENLKEPPVVGKEEVEKDVEVEKENNKEVEKENEEVVKEDEGIAL